MQSKILVTGAVGQIGSELTVALRKKYGNDNVVAGWHRKEPSGLLAAGPAEKIDVTDKDALKAVIEKYEINTVYHLVSLLSAVGEKKPDLAWKINMGSLKDILDLARDYKLKIFWPSSIAAFGPTTPQDNTPQKTILEPNTMYGVTKVAGELLVNYYFKKFGVDTRSLRYPGLISWKTPPGGGTTDYAIEIFHEALNKGTYACFLKKDTSLPMMYMDDAISATMQIMSVPSSKIKTRLSYNITAMSFTPVQIAAEIRKHIPAFKITYKPDFRQEIADSWPNSIDDSAARNDWGWKNKFDLPRMVEDMLTNLGKQLEITSHNEALKPMHTPAQNV